MKKRIFGGLIVAAIILFALVSCEDEGFTSIPSIPGGIYQPGLAPDGLTLSANADGFSWNLRRDAIGYKVYRTLTPVEDFTFYKTVPSNELKIEHKKGDHFYYRVSSAYYGGGESDLCEGYVEIKTDDDEHHQGVIHE